MNATVKDVMTSSVVWTRKDATFKEMAILLRSRRISALPVLDLDGKVIGIVSEGDLLLKQALLDSGGGWPPMVTTLLHHGELHKARQGTAAGLMTSPAVTVTKDASVEHAARLMHARKIKQLPVVDEAGHLTGIVSRSDLLTVFDRADEEIASEIRNDLILGRFLMDPSRFAVRVSKGVVILAGRPETAALGHDLVDEVRHVPGVVDVQDQLTYPEPNNVTAPGFYVRAPR